MSAHHTCFILEARRVEEETYGEVKALRLRSEFIMLTGAWLSPKHNSWWSEEPEVEPQGVRWPAHSFTGSLHRGQETAGFWEQEMRLASFQILAPSRSQRTRTCQEASQWQMFNLTREKFKGPKHWTYAQQPIDPNKPSQNVWRGFSNRPWINRTMKAGDILSQTSSPFSQCQDFRLVLSWH